MRADNALNSAVPGVSRGYGRGDMLARSSVSRWQVRPVSAVA
jgi:hypothetical protein